jgi:hypothetical protein
VLASTQVLVGGCVQVTPAHASPVHAPAEQPEAQVVCVLA